MRFAWLGRRQVRIWACSICIRSASWSALASHVPKSKKSPSRDASSKKTVAAATSRDASSRKATAGAAGTATSRDASSKKAATRGDASNKKTTAAASQNASSEKAVAAAGTIRDASSKKTATAATSRDASSKKKAAAAGTIRTRLTEQEMAELPLNQVLETLSQQSRVGEKQLDILLGRCARERASEEGRKLHKIILKQGAEPSRLVTNRLVYMYGMCKDMKRAKSVFAKTKAKNLHSWVMIILACLQNDEPEAAIKLYRQMQLEGCTPDAQLLTSIFTASTLIGDLALGKSIHASIQDQAQFRCEPILARTIINMYKKCGDSQDVEKAMELVQPNWREMLVANREDWPDDSEGIWCSRIAGFMAAGEEASAIRTLKYMDLEGVKIASRFTFTSLVNACATLAAIAQGKSLHERILEWKIQLDDVLRTALLNMYAKCGKIGEARTVFDTIQDTARIPCTSMIAAYARNGHFDEALKIFWGMEQAGCRGDSITFTHVLYACSHGGFIDEAWEYFTSLSLDRKIPIKAEHYGCVVDLLARAGWLAEAEQFLLKMPVPPDDVCWMSLLQACRMHRCPEIGARAAEHVYRLAPRRAGPYSLLTNIYCDAGRFDLADKVQKLMRDRGVKKPGGRSWIEIGGKLHEFIVGDSWHPLLKEIGAEIQRMSKLMKEAGYVPDTKQVLHDAEEEEKEDILYYHSEKLAIGLGLIKTPPGTMIKVVKNIRVCPDCHTAAKYMSKVSQRKIVIRDINLFHHFEDGKCSCGDYW